MAKQADKAREEQRLGQAEAPDYDFLDKPLDGYPPGTTFELGAGKPVDVTKLDDAFAAPAKRSK